MDHKIVPITDALAAHNDKQRNWVKGHFVENHDEKYAPLEGKLRLLDTIIRQKWIEPHEKWKLQALGITFGDALEQALKMQWVMVVDEDGETPALTFPGKALEVFPLTAISKRIERGEEVDIYELFNGFCDMVRNRAEVGRVEQKLN